MHNVRCVNAVKDHVHDRNDVGQRLFLLSVKALLLERFQILRRQSLFVLHVIERFTQETRRSASIVANAFTDFRFDHLDHGANQRPGRVILAAVPASVAHVLDLGFVQMRQLVLLGLRTEPQSVNVVDDLAQVVARLNPVLDLAENRADLCIRSCPARWPAAESRADTERAFR